MTPREKADTLALWLHWLQGGGDYLHRAHLLGYWPSAVSEEPCGPAMSGIERNLLATAVLMDANGEHPAGCRICRTQVVAVAA